VRHNEACRLLHRCPAAVRSAGLGHGARHVLDVVSRSAMAILTTGTWATLE